MWWWLSTEEAGEGVLALELLEWNWWKVPGAGPTAGLGALKIGVV